MNWTTGEIGDPSKAGIQTAEALRVIAEMLIARGGK